MVARKKAVASETPAVSFFDEKAVEREISPLRTEAERVRAMALQVHVQTHEAYTVAADGLLDIAERVKAAEARRDSSIGLIKKGLKALEAIWRAGIKPYGEAEEHLRAELGRYAAECETKRDDKLKAAAIAEDRDTAVSLISSAEAELAPKISGIGYRGGFEWQVLNFDQVPEEFKKVVVDEEKLSAFVKTNGASMVGPDARVQVAGVYVKDGRSVIVSTERRTK